MTKTMTKTKTKTLIAVALVVLSVVGTVAGIIIVSRKTGVGFSGNSYSAIKKALIKQPAVSTNPTTVTAAVCGNGQLEKGEECDDGNKKSGDGCTGCPTNCQTSFNSVNSIFNINTADATSCTGAYEGCGTSNDWSCVGGTCYNARCGDGICNDCANAFSPCTSNNSENNSNCPGDCKATTPPNPPPTPPITPSGGCSSAGDCGGTDRYSCLNGKCQSGRCGDGVCNDCSDAFSPCTPVETNANCQNDCKATASPTPDQCQACAGGCKIESANPVPDNTADCIDIGPQFPAHTSDQSIPAKSVVNYCFTIDKDVNTAIIPYIRSRDWWTSSHMFVSNVKNPTKAEIEQIIASGSTINRVGSPPWYSLGGGSNERLVLSRSAKAGEKYYVTVYNTEESASSLIQLYWQAY